MENVLGLPPCTDSLPQQKRAQDRSPEPFLVKVVQVRLGNTGSARTALDGVFLCARNDPSGDQSVAKLGYATHKLAVVLGCGSNVRYQIRDRAATCEQSIRHPRIAPANHNRRSEVRIRLTIQSICEA